MIVINQMMQLFLLMMIGCLLFKLKVLNKSTVKDLNGFVLNVTMPCMILTSVLVAQRKGLPIKDILTATAILVILLPVASYLFLNLARIKKNTGLWLFMMMYPNVGFMGFPLMKALYGDESILYTAIINMAFNVSLFSIGKMCMMGKGDQRTKMNWKFLCSPGIISSLVAIAFYLTSFSMPEIILNPLKMLGNMTTPLAMMIIGSVIAQYPVKEIFFSKKIYAFVFLIDIVLPLFFFPFLNCFIQDSLTKGIAVIILSMPVANGSVMFAEQYGQPVVKAAQTVCLSTLLSVITIPVVMKICGM
jgi:predicted permease